MKKLKSPIAIWQKYNVERKKSSYRNDSTITKFKSNQMKQYIVYKNIQM